MERLWEWRRASYGWSPQSELDAVGIGLDVSFPKDLLQFDCWLLRRTEQTKNENETEKEPAQFTAGILSDALPRWRG